MRFKSVAVMLLALVLVALVPVSANVGATTSNACEDVYNENVAKCQRDFETCMVSTFGSSWCYIGRQSCMAAQWSFFQYCNAWPQ